MITEFRRLNHNWNADPNDPEPNLSLFGDTLTLTFYANHYLYSRFKENQRLQLVFRDTWRYHLEGTNDEGWYRGQCRFTGIAPQWGEFYEITGDLRLSECTNKWHYARGSEPSEMRHFLFYFRDNAFECDARSFEFYE